MLNKIKSKIKLTKKSSSVPARRIRAGENSKSYVVNKTIVDRFNFNKLKPQISDNDQSVRSKTNKLSLHRRRVVFLLLSLIAICSVLIFLLFQLTASVSVSIGTGSKSIMIDKEYYKIAIEKYLNAYPIARLRFMFNEESAISYLKEQYPEIESIQDLGKDELNITKYELNLRKPVASWKVNSKNYYVDKYGVAFEKNYFNEPTVSIIDDSGIKTNDVTFVASNRFLNFVSQVVTSALASGYKVTEAVIPEGTTRQLAIKIDGVGGIVKLSLDRPASEQVEDMHNAITYLKLKGVVTSYIDVRVKHKAYYK